jgi:thiol-disulfide isomerase/thioredoxin
LAFAALAGAAVLLLLVLYGKTGTAVHAPPLPLATAPPHAPALLKPVAPPSPAPTAAFAGPGGKPVHLQDFRGRYVLLNLWAPWCAPCVKELPALAALQQSLPAARFAVVAVDVGGEGQAEAQAFLASRSAGALKAYADTDVALMRALAGVGLPISLLIDPKGKVIARIDGPLDWSSPETVAYLRWRVAR